MLRAITPPDEEFIMSMLEQIEQLTLEEFVRLYEKEGPFEFIDGQKKPIMPPVAIHGITVRALFLFLYNHCVARNRGEVIQEMPYVLLYNSTWVTGSRVPDLMFFAAEHWAKYIAETKDWLGKPFILVPDLAVEVVSPNDTYVEIQAKVDRYLADGVRLIWVVDPQRQRVNIYQGSQHVTLGKEATLTGGDVLPGLEIPLGDVFKA
jgi:Uma2 family endonuclease